MSTEYNKTTWQDGDVITADKMNNIENGIYAYNEDIANLEIGKQDALTFDQTPTAESENPVTSAGVKNAIEAAVNVTAPGIYETASGSVINFTDGADDMPLKSCVVNIEPIQEGEGDPSPDNVRPISGRTGLTVSHSGADTSNPTTISINWETEVGTVYGGSLDIVSGKLLVDRAYWTLSEYDTIYDYPTQNGFRLRASVMQKGRALNGVASWLKTISEETQYGILFGADNNGIYFCHITDNIAGISDLNSFKMYLSEHPLQIVYPIESPREIQLTPQEITTLLGTNNFWSDGDNIELEYLVDTKAYVDKNTIDDVQVNGTSILDEQGVANVQTAADNTFGVVKVATNGFYGIRYFNSSNDTHKFLVINPATNEEIKRGVLEYHPIVAMRQHMAAFYGLAKAAGDTTQSASSNAVGTYTEDAKSAISEMLNGSVAVSGTAPTINAKAGIRYICGEVLSLDITLPASGIVDVVFTSGSTPTVLTITPPTGQAVKWANGFDPTTLDTDTVYEINVADGLGVAASWT